MDRILAAVDGSHPADAAARTAFALARAVDAEAHVLAVVPAEAVERAVTRKTARDRAAKALDRAGELAAEVGASVQTHRRTGEPAETISTVAAELNVDLIAVGRHGSGGVRERLLGSVTHRLLRTASWPVLVVPAGGGGSDRVTELVATTDGSDAATLMAPLVGTIAAGTGATVHVLSVADIEGASGLFSPGGPSEAFVREVTERAEVAAETFAERIRTEGNLSSVRTLVRKGIPHEEIVSYANDIEADLIVMSSRGESSATGQLLGSVAGRVLRTTRVPVVVCPVD